MTKCDSTLEQNSTDSSSNSFNWSSYCQYRLPCGICQKTNSQCPYAGVNPYVQPYNPIYPVYPTYPIVTYTTGTSVKTGEGTADNKIK